MSETYSQTYMRSYAAERPPVAKAGTDKELAEAIIQSMRRLQDAMDAAIMAGLIVEPTFTPMPNRFSEVGVTTDSYVLNVQIYRKLS